MLEGRKRRLDCSIKRTSSPAPAGRTRNSLLDASTFLSPNDCNTMTRKPMRTRRPRIPIIQSGYCAICNLPYNSVEDHVQSKKHQKLIGEDANFISLNGYIHSDVGIESLLSLTSIDSIGFEDFPSPKIRRKAMSKAKAPSIMSDVVKSSETIENEPKHRLRSRKNVNYMTPPLDEDNLSEKNDLEPVRLEYKEYRELRSSTRALAKLTSLPMGQELWDSGRPKRACINRPKRVSADERLVNDNKTYYKVEVLSNKLRSSDKDNKEANKLPQTKQTESDKGLIVKFKKLRNSELVQLNNEATNFLFPKREESSEEDEMDEVKEEPTTETEEEEEEEKNMVESEHNEEVIISVTSSSEIEDVKPPDKFKVEEESSMDSISSECKKRRKRRSHAEAFIMDNQKYYKFETPGSSSYRLRYHGSYLSPVPTKSNGDFATKTEKVCVVEKKEKPERLKVNLDDFKFSFETVPENEKWYKTFQRQDRSEQRYQFSRNYYWDDFVMPQRIPHLKAIDPKLCYQAYREILDAILEKKKAESILDDEPPSANGDVSCEIPSESSPENLDEKETEDSVMIDQTDEDSKFSEVSAGTSSIIEEPPVVQKERRRPGRKRKVLSLSPKVASGGGKNPRKSPRQHASTLAILSSFIHQRKRRSRTLTNNEPNVSLQAIPEEQCSTDEQKQLVAAQPLESSSLPQQPPQKIRKKRVDYIAIANRMEEEFDATIGDDFELDIEPTTDPDFERFKASRLNVDDIMTLYEKSREKGFDRSPKKLFHGVPGRKPGKRKKNKTGWPKVKKRKAPKDSECAAGAADVNHIESEEDEDHEDCDSAVEEDGNHNHKKAADEEDEVEEEDCNSDRVVDRSSEVRDCKLQPYVYVKKLDTVDAKKPHGSLKRTVRRPQRRIVTSSPKSPRMLRRPRGRWYRER